LFTFVDASRGHLCDSTAFLSSDEGADSTTSDIVRTVEKITRETVQ